jgi:biotin synthase
MGRVSKDDVARVYGKPFFELVYEATTVHRANHDPQVVEWATLLSIKTGACPEDCGYCAQSAHYDTGLQSEPLMELESVVAAARDAKARGSTRFCMGAAWRRVADRDMPALTTMIGAVKEMGLETCVTLGSITRQQADAFKSAGLDYYNHNLDTSRDHYGSIITTRTYDERLETLEHVRAAGIAVCCGGILGMGETRRDRLELLAELASLEPQPESVPINQLVAIEGTPLHDQGVEPVDKFELVRMIATARILMPRAAVRLSAGRESMTEELQALCFLAGANSIFVGDKLLTTGNRGFDPDQELFRRLDLRTAVEPEA